MALGADATLNVTATGSGPLAYQWRLNGINIAGATTSSLALHALQFANAGLYSVQVTNQAGMVFSSAAILNVSPRLYYQAGTNGLTLTWASPYILQRATSITGPFTDVPGATSPYFYSAAGPQYYFRLRAPDFSLSVNRLAGGRFSLSSPGIPGCNFILQATTDFHSWVNLTTNSFPCSFVDSAAPQYPHRFYRAALAQ
jgi:hypothetical protein